MSTRDERKPKAHARRDRGPDHPPGEAAMRAPAAPSWQVAAASIPDHGIAGTRSLDREQRRALAEALALTRCDSLIVSYELRPAGRGRFRLTGRLEAAVEQSCVVTLEPVHNRIDEPLDILFAPDAARAPREADLLLEAGDAPDVEAIRDGTLDLGQAVYEVFAAAIDPYPHRPGAAFTLPEDPDSDEAGAPHPFAALAKLRRSD